MKVPALRRGNLEGLLRLRPALAGLNESPRPKAGKFAQFAAQVRVTPGASMKVPALRRGN